MEKIDSRNLTNSRGMTYQSHAAFVPKKNYTALAKWWPQQEFNKSSQHILIAIVQSGRRNCNPIEYSSFFCEFCKDDKSGAVVKW
jgi:hypothetical protein